MTKEEAIKIAQGLIRDFKCESEVMVEFCNVVIKALEQEPMLDKIRAEIDGIEINGRVDEHTLFIRTGEQVKQMTLDIIDKYRKGN